MRKHILTYVAIYKLTHLKLKLMETMKNAIVENVNEVYEAPKCEVIVMQSEGMICSSGGEQSTYDDFIEYDYSNSGLW